MKKIVSALIILALLVPMYQAYAQQFYNINYETKTENGVNYLEISGEYGTAGEYISIVVVDDKYKDVEITPDHLDKVLYAYDTYANGGQFSFKIPLNSRMLDTTLYVKVGAHNEITSFTVQTIDQGKIERLINYINTKSASELAVLILENIEDYAKLNYRTADYQALGNDILRMEVCTLLEEGKRPYVDSKKAFNEALFLVSVNNCDSTESLSALMGKYSEELSLDLSQNANYRKIVENEMNDLLLEITLGKKPYTSFEGFKTVYIQSVDETADIVDDVIKINNINKAEYNEIINVLNNYRAWIGIDVKSAYDDMTNANKDKFINAIISYTFRTKTDIISEINKLINMYKKAPNVGSGGGSSGGGNSGGSRGSSISVPIANITGEVAISKQRNYFEDIDDVPWAKSAIENLKENDIINGVTETIFEPHRNITREQLVKIIIAAFKIPLTHTEQQQFEDVSKSDWFYSYVQSAYENGIIKGVTQNKFGTAMEVTRQDLAVMIYRVLEKTDKLISVSNSEAVFADNEQIADYAKVAVNYFAANGIINGSVQDETIVFLPNRYATRAETAKIIYEVMKQWQD